MSRLDPAVVPNWRSQQHIEHTATALVAEYLAQLFTVVVLAWSPHRIVLGGGVMQTPGLIEQVTHAFRRLNCGYGVGTAAVEHGFLVAAVHPKPGWKVPC